MHTLVMRLKGAGALDCAQLTFGSESFMVNCQGLLWCRIPAEISLADEVRKTYRHQTKPLLYQSIDVGVDFEVTSEQVEIEIQTEIL